MGSMHTQSKCIDIEEDNINDKSTVDNYFDIMVKEHSLLWEELSIQPEENIFDTDEMNNYARAYGQASISEYHGKISKHVVEIKKENIDISLLPLGLRRYNTSERSDRTATPTMMLTDGEGGGERGGGESEGVFNERNFDQNGDPYPSRPSTTASVGGGGGGSGNRGRSAVVSGSGGAGGRGGGSHSASSEHKNMTDNNDDDKSVTSQETHSTGGTNKSEKYNQSQKSNMSGKSNQSQKSNRSEKNNDNYGQSSSKNSERSEERRVGKECLHQCRSRWSPYH